MTAAEPSVSSSHPYLAMGLMFLLLGIGFASPVPLVRTFPHGMWEGQISRETLNLYALTVFLGWGHFFYAWQGQWRGTSRLPAGRRISYWSLVLLMLAVLATVRSVMGVAVFSLVVWVYNIAHFIKAERFFGANVARATPRTRPGFFMPAIAFAWFTLVLFEAGPLVERLPVFIGSLALAAVALLTGDWRALAAGQVRLPLLTLFLLGETLLWNAYGPTPAFRVGVYVVHIGAASFFHYLGGYFFAQRGESTPALVRPAAILAINATVFILGCAVSRVHALSQLRFVLAPEWFTLWVALHLAASDLLPWWKRPALQRSIA